MSDVEHMVRIPIDERALKELESLLTSADVFTTTFQHLGPAIFLAETYIWESLNHGTKCVFMVDRNLFTRLLSLGRGERATHAHQVAAAVLAFAQTTESLIEPNMALYELAATADTRTARMELVEFRRLDNSHPQLFADVAVGRRDSIDLIYLSGYPVAEAPDIDFTKPLRRWRANYTAALKIATLELSPVPAERKMAEFISWMQNEFLFIGPAVCLANRYLAPNGPKKRLFKSLRSTNRDRALKGIRNAAWDMAFVSEWSYKIGTQCESDKLWILASLDRGLHEVARAFVLPAGSVKSVDASIRDEFVTLWGAYKGDCLVNLYQECLRNRESGASPMQSVTSEKARETIRNLEAQVLDGKQIEGQA
ncbi:MAG: hypothetical protein AABY96_13375 [Nitrospirota bacterium]